MGTGVQGYKRTLKALPQGNLKLPGWPKSWGFKSWPTQGHEEHQKDLCAHK